MAKLIEVEQEVGQSATATLIQYAKIAWRGKWIIIAAMVLSLTAGWSYCQLAPKLYRSETLILVEDPKVQENYVQGVAEGKIEQRIFLIQKEISNRVFLAEVVKELNLYPDTVAEFGLDQAASLLADSLMVEMINKGSLGNFVSETGPDAFTISFGHPDPVTAQLVTARIASWFIEENRKAREEVAQGTSEFLDAEVLRAQKELEKKEDEVGRFKSQQIGYLPQQIEANLRALDRLSNDLNGVNESIQRLTDRLTAVEKAVREYQRFGRTNLGLVTGGIQTDPLFRQLTDLREKLGKLKAEFWDAYPEVLLTKEELHQVEAQLVELYGSESIKPAKNLPDPYMQDLTKQQSEMKSELALLKHRHQMLQTERKEYEKRIEKSPEVEQDLLILERDYENMKSNYRSLLEKRLNARVVQNLEKRKKGSQFRILDPAFFPRLPVQPNQQRIMVFALILGCVLGLGMTLMRDQLNPRFRRAEEVEQLFGPHLLAVIPDFSFECGRVSWYNRIGWNRLPPRDGTVEASGQGIDGSEVRTIVSNGLLDKQSDGQPFQDSFVVKWLPNSTVAEQYRVAATRLALVKTDGQSAVVAVTSAIKDEGKTTTVINLGYTMARDLGKRTLILDCDFKCPMLHHYAKTVPKWGLADCLIGDIPLDDCLFGFEDAPCWIMPVGSPDVHPTELLKSERLAGILAQLRARFEYIFINTPPILPLATMNILAGHADILLLVVRADSTPRQLVQRALSSLPSSVPAHLVLNAVRHQALSSYMGIYQHLAR